MTTTSTDPKVQQWTNLAQQLRVDSIRCTTAAGSGHPTSSMSAARPDGCFIDRLPALRF